MLGKLSTPSVFLTKDKSVKNGHVDGCLSASSTRTAPRSGSYWSSFQNHHECSRHDFGVSYLIDARAAHAAS